MKFIYPGINAPLDTEKSLYAETTQGYFSHKESGKALDFNFIKKQESYFSQWDKRTAFTCEEYKALTHQQRLQLYRLHTTRWNYTLSLLLKDPGAGPDSPLYAEKQFLQNLNENEEMRKLYAGWFIDYVESREGETSKAVEALFKKEMQLKPECDLSKEKQIAVKVRGFRDEITELQAWLMNGSSAERIAIEKYDTKAVNQFIKYQLGQVSKSEFNKTFERAQSKCNKVLKNALHLTTSAASILTEKKIDLNSSVEWERLKNSQHLQKAVLILHKSNINLADSWDTLKDNSHLQKAVLTLHHESSINLTEHWDKVKNNSPLQKALAASYDYLNAERSSWSKMHHNHGIRQTHKFIRHLMASENQTLSGIQAEMQQWLHGYGHFSRASGSASNSRMSFALQSGLCPQADTPPLCSLILAFRQLKSNKK
ncbi:hypothetical protein [Piscirickettsia salmonis]|uniref:hypothetical protein n=1 Tax=Piscirickettsia salmonis TaxID=1238 RepID=UPI00065F541C|nr:hypothetical protein [Piscirickettsia salmonis]AKP73485.1 hypothetical protein PSLF89_1625 [Piscirickettsia salmonis LF-89 = ATCC VR-1361]